MSAYSLLDALSFDISFIEIRQEIKLLEHFGIIEDHRVFIYFYSEGDIGAVITYEKKDQIFSLSY
jgi:hypothetical protein